MTDQASGICPLCDVQMESCLEHDFCPTHNIWYDRSRICPCCPLPLNRYLTAHENIVKNCLQLENDMETSAMGDADGVGEDYRRMNELVIGRLLSFFVRHEGRVQEWPLCPKCPMKTFILTGKELSSAIMGYVVHCTRCHEMWICGTCSAYFANKDEVELHSGPAGSCPRFAGDKRVAMARNSLSYRVIHGIVSLVRALIKTYSVDRVKEILNILQTQEPEDYKYLIPTLWNKSRQQRAHYYANRALCYCTGDELSNHSVYSCSIYDAIPNVQEEGDDDSVICGNESREAN